MFHTVKITDKNQVKNTLDNNICRVTFTKANGDKRVLIGTRQSGIAPDSLGSRKGNPDIIPVYDIEEDGYRSFAYSRLQSLEICEDLLGD